ncbi:alpha/beta hydrolase [Maricaulis sp. CAU 1757]
MSYAAWPSALSKLKLDDAFEPERAAARLRQALRKATPLIDGKPEPVGAVRELTVPGPDGERPARLYVPAGNEGPSPCALYLHGGGYVIGDLDTHDPLCRRLAAMSNVRIVALDYRLAPEHVFPAAVEDALTALDWIAGDGAGVAGANPDMLAVAGDSAGGGLAAVVAQERRARIRFQLLIYPLLQLAERRKSKPKAVEGHLLSTLALDQIVRAYMPGGDVRDPRVSPLFQDDLAGLPPAHIFAAELDPLFDEGAAYRDRLRAGGLDCGYTLGKGMPHGYFNLTQVVPGARALVHEAAAVLADGLRR